MDSNMAPGCGRAPRVIAMWGSGGWAKLRATGFMSGSTEIGTKANLKIVSNKGKAHKNLPMVISTKESTSEASPTATGSTTGQIAATSKAISNKD